MLVVARQILRERSQKCCLIVTTKSFLFMQTQNVKACRLPAVVHEAFWPRQRRRDVTAVGRCRTTSLTSVWCVGPSGSEGHTQ